MGPRNYKVTALLWALLFAWLALGGQGWAQTISVTLRTPNGGETWEAGSTQNITWETSGTPDSINLYYSLDNGSSFTTIVSGASDNGSYPWPVPVAVTSQALISIEAVKSPDIVTAESAAVFSLVDTTAPSVAVDFPSGGEKWLGGSSQPITFEASDLFGINSTNSLNIWYSTDNGTSYPNLVTSDAAVAVPYVWTCPLLSTTEVKVRVSVKDSNANPGTNESLAKFTIDSTAPSVTLVQPNSGTLTGGTTYEVKWTASDECGLAATPITLSYSTNSGTSWTPITNEANTGLYIWTVPAINISTARVSVEALNQVGLVGRAMSSSDLTIFTDVLGPAITVNSPAGGEKWQGGTTQAIAFSATDQTGIKTDSLEIWYSTDNGLTYTNQVTSDASIVSPYSWNLPLTISTTEVKVRLWLTDSSLNHNLGTAESAPFTIDSTAPNVTVIQPNGGPPSLSGDNATYEIKWTATDECGLTATPITLRYSTNSGTGWTFITNEANTGSYTWTVPHINTSLARVSVEAQNLVGLVGSDMSDNDFSITSDVTGPSVTVGAPVGGEKWRGGTAHLIMFEASDPSGVKPDRYSIYYSTDDGSTFPNVITSEATLTSSYGWNVPGTINSTHVRIRVTARDIFDNLGTGESTSSFTIDSTPPTVTSVMPNGGEKWQGEVNNNISWSVTENFNLKTNPITLQYSTNEGTSWINITSEVANASPYSWPVPSLNTNEAKVKVLAEDECGNIGSAESATHFIIDITPPGTPNPLTQLTGSATNDATPYFRWSAPADNLSGISSYEIIIDTTVTTQGATTNFTSPALLEGLHTWEVRAQDGAGLWGSYCTPQRFNLILTAPAITSLTLKDRFTGSTSYAKNTLVLVSLEAGGVGGGATEMISSESSNFSGAAWQAYHQQSTFQLGTAQGSHEVYYKVRDAALNQSTTVEAAITLDTYFPVVTINNPNGGENLGSGLTYTISWDAYDLGGLKVNPITIRFSHDGGPWAVLVSNEVNSKKYEWTVPGGIDSTACRISLEADDLAGNAEFDQNDNYFTIISAGPLAPTITWPANGSYVNTRSPQFQWTAVANAVSYQGVLDLAEETNTISNSYLPSYFLADGSHTFWVRAVNAADLWSDSSETSTFIVDATGPTLAFDPFTDTENPQPSFYGLAQDNFKVVSAEARLDNGAWLPAVATDGSFNSTHEAFVFSAPALIAKGSHTLEARVYDVAGNINSSPALLNFLITKSLVSFDVKMGSADVPSGTIIPFRPTFMVSFTSPLPIVDFKVYLDNQSVYAHTGSFTAETVAISPFQDLSVGSHSLRMTTQNIAGDVFTKEVTGLTVISDVRVFMTASATTISLAINTSSSGPATLIIRRPNGQTILQKTIPDIGDASQITIDKYIVGENLKGPYLWRVIYNSGRSSKSGGFLVP
jgi:hypothetical protein